MQLQRQVGNVAVARMLQSDFEMKALGAEYRGEEKTENVAYYREGPSQIENIYVLRNGLLCHPLTKQALPKRQFPAQGGLRPEDLAQHVQTQMFLTRHGANAAESEYGSKASGLDYIYVMDADGRFYVTTQAVGRVHHSSLLEGNEVACAGHLKASDGKITMISNQSGHYKPTLSQFRKALAFIEQNGVNLESIHEVHVTGMLAGHDLGNVLFNNAMHFTLEYDRLSGSQQQNPEDGGAAQAADPYAGLQVSPPEQGGQEQDDDPYAELRVTAPAEGELQDDEGQQ